MNAKKLREALSKFPDEAVVLAYDAESELEEEVTGLLFEMREDHGTGKKIPLLTICTDE